jgi:hypothetical protein
MPRGRKRMHGATRSVPTTTSPAPARTGSRGCSLSGSLASRADPTRPPRPRVSDSDAGHDYGAVTLQCQVVRADSSSQKWTPAAVERHVNGGNRCGRWRRDGRREALAHCFTEGHHDAAANSAGHATETHPAADMNGNDFGISSLTSCRPRVRQNRRGAVPQLTDAATLRLI